MFEDKSPDLPSQIWDDFQLITSKYAAMTQKIIKEKSSFLPFVAILNKNNDVIATEILKTKQKYVLEEHIGSLLTKINPNRDTHKAIGLFYDSELVVPEGVRKKAIILEMEHVDGERRRVAFTYERGMLSVTIGDIYFFRDTRNIFPK